MKPFYVCVVLNPSDKQVEEEDTISVIVVQPAVVLAKDIESAKMKAVRLIPEEHVDKLDKSNRLGEPRLQVYVCPFV